jgi:hypothetical protein
LRPLAPRLSAAVVPDVDVNRNVCIVFIFAARLVRLYAYVCLLCGVNTDERGRAIGSKILFEFNRSINRATTDDACARVIATTNASGVCATTAVRLRALREACTR